MRHARVGQQQRLPGVSIQCQAALGPLVAAEGTAHTGVARLGRRQELGLKEAVLVVHRVVGEEVGVPRAGSVSRTQTLAVTFGCNVADSIQQILIEVSEDVGSTRIKHKAAHEFRDAIVARCHTAAC